VGALNRVSQNQEGSDMRRYIATSLATCLALSLVLWSCGRPIGRSTDRLFVEVSPKRLPADGQSTATVTAFLRDPAGDPVTEGTVVFFRSTQGRLDPPQVAVSNGLATTTLTVGLTAGPVIVTAFTEEGLQASETIELEPSTAGRIELSCSPTVIEADGLSESVCRADVRLPNGDPVPNNTPVLFSTTAGTLTNASATTMNGFAVTGLRSTTTGQRATVTAISGGMQAQTSVQFTEVLVSRVDVASSRNQIRADGRDQTTITATVRMRNGSFAPDGTTVSCVTSRGTLSPTSPQTLNGVATTTLTAGTTAGTAQVVCTAGNVSGSRNVTFTGTGQAGQIRARANPQTIRVGGQTSSIRATLTAEDASPVAGARVFFSVSGPAGTTIAPDTATTDANGEAIAILTSGLQAGTARVLAESGALSDSVDVVIEPEAAQRLSLSAPGSVSTPSTSTVSATVLDAFGNPVRDGTIVNFSIACPGGGNNSDACDGVSLQSSTTFTSNGVASNSLSVGSGTTETTVRLRAQAQGGANPSDVRTIQIVPPPPTPTPTR
jgi:adhesin/invasin